MKKKSVITLNMTSILLAMIVINIIPIKVWATSLNEYQLGEVVNAGKDTGFAEENEIDKKDPHFNWELGQFLVRGYTRAIVDRDKPIFLKTVGDTVVLTFKLKQNIDALNGSESLVVANDKRAYDIKLQTEETAFGRGALLIRKTDAYTNKKGQTQLYVDYLPALVVGANTQVEVCEEGDYEVALDYSVKDKKINVPVVNQTLYSTDNDYKISFSFSIRNGNCMVFPFDVKTGEELTNTTITENGFYLDLAKSRYLEINVKREVLYKGANGLAEDVRFNKPATDGEKYTDEGIYTIKVSNPYTKEVTVKKICVGTNKLLKAYMITGYSINDIRSLIRDGATIDKEGNIVMPPKPEPATEIESKVESETTETNETTSMQAQSVSETMLVEVNTSVSNGNLQGEENNDKSNNYIVIGSIGITLVLFVVLLIYS